MSYSSLINTNGEEYGTYSYSAVKLFGLPVAVYLQWLVFLDVKTDRKKAKANGFIVVDRKFITDKTGFTITEQHGFDTTLSDSALSILEVNPTNPELVKFYPVNYLKILNSDGDRLVQAQVKMAVNKKEIRHTARNAGKIERLKQCVDDKKFSEAVCVSLYKWIEALFECGKVPNSVTVTHAQDFLSEFCSGNEKAQLEIISSATASNHVELSYSYKNYLAVHHLSSIPSSDNIPPEVSQNYNMSLHAGETF